MRHRLSWFCAAVCALFVAQPPLFAQGLVDPMRPPQARDESAAPGRAPGSGVQVIITSPGRNLAVIDGVVVPLGAAVRNGTLSSISDSLAVLKKNGGHDVLLMHPDIDKKPARRERP